MSIDFRYEKDWICLAAKFQQIRKVFGDTLDGEGSPRSKHAILTEYLHQKTPEKMIQYLKEYL